MLTRVQVEASDGLYVEKWRNLRSLARFCLSLSGGRGGRSTISNHKGSACKALCRGRVEFDSPPEPHRFSPQWPGLLSIGRGRPRCAEHK